MTNEDEVLAAQCRKMNLVKKIRQTNYLVKPLLSRKFAQIVIFRQIDGIFEQINCKFVFFLSIRRYMYYFTEYC